MTQMGIRVKIFLLWGGALLSSIILVLLAPILVHDGTFDHAQIYALLPGVFALYVPALSCLAGFWFPNKERSRVRAMKVEKERCQMAMALTALYLTVTLVLLMWPLYFTQYPNALEPVAGAALEDRMNLAIRYCAILSPIALAPIHYLTSS